MILRPPRSTPLYSSAASDVYKRQGIDIAGSVHSFGLVEQDHLRCCEVVVTVIIERVYKRAQPSRIDRGVVVEQGHILATGVEDPRVDRFGEPTVVRALQYAHLGAMLPDPRDTAVARGVVDQDDLEVRNGLRRKCLKAVREVTQAVPVGDDDRDSR